MIRIDHTLHVDGINTIRIEHYWRMRLGVRQTGVAIVNAIYLLYAVFLGWGFNNTFDYRVKAGIVAAGHDGGMSK